MRQFSLENEIGSAFPLNGEFGATFADVSGLGVENSIETADLSEGFFKVVRKTSAERTITGTVYFPVANCYELYRDFIDYIMAAKELYLCYKPGATVYRCAVTLNFISVNEDSPRSAAISFICQSPWYKSIPLPVAFADPTTDDVFRWNVSAWGVNPWAASTDGRYSASVTPTGHIPAALRINFTGTITNPTITLTGSSGRIYGRCSITGDFGDTTITLDTRYGVASVTSLSAGTVTDLLDAVDITTEPFFRVPISEPCTLTVSGENISGTCSAEMFAYYRSV